jgi:hypothetical protein
MSFYMYCIKCHKKIHSDSHCFLHWKVQTTAFATPETETPSTAPTPKPKLHTKGHTTKVLYYNSYLGIYQEGGKYFNWLHFNTGQ